MSTTPLRTIAPSRRNFLGGTAALLLVASASGLLAPGTARAADRTSTEASPTPASCTPPTTSPA